MQVGYSGNRVNIGLWAAISSIVHLPQKRFNWKKVSEEL